MQITYQTIKQAVLDVADGASQINRGYIATEVADMLAEQIDEEFDHELNDEQYTALRATFAEIIADQINWQEVEEFNNPTLREQREKAEREEAIAEANRYE